MEECYVVIYRDYDISRIHGVFSTLELADQYVEKYTFSEGSSIWDAEGPEDLYVETVYFNPKN